MKLEHLRGVESSLNKQIRENKKKGHSEKFKREAERRGIKRPNSPFAVVVGEKAPWLKKKWDWKQKKTKTNSNWK